MSATAQSVLTWAAAQVKTMEKPPDSNMQPYAALAGHKNGQAWCATFIVAGLKVNGVPMVPGTNTAFTPSMHDAYKNAGRLFTMPRPGDTGYVFYANLNRIGHVFFVEKIEGDFVRTIEGNTNLDGSPTGNGVYRHKRRWRNGGGNLRGFGRPQYGAPASRPTVTLSHVKHAAITNAPGPDGATSFPADVRIIEAALLAEGLLSARYAKDGSFGTTTVVAYGQWQRRCGFTSKEDTNGIPGIGTLRTLGLRHGFLAVDA